MCSKGILLSSLKHFRAAVVLKAYFPSLPFTAEFLFKYNTASWDPLHRGTPVHLHPLAMLNAQPNRWESNCRPVVWTLLTNAQVAIYRAFWNWIWAGSRGTPVNYQHLNFLFNAGKGKNRGILAEEDWKLVRKIIDIRSPTAALLENWDEGSTSSNESLAVQQLPREKMRQRPQIQPRKNT